MASSPEDSEKEDPNEIIETNSADFSKAVYGRQFLLDIRKIESGRTCPLSHEEIKDFGLDRESMRVRSLPRFVTKPKMAKKVSALKPVDGLLPILRLPPPSENAWRPERQRATEDVSEEKAAIKDICKKVRSLFNKVTPTTQEHLTKEFLSYNIPPCKLWKIILGVASLNPLHCPLYAEMFKAKIEEDALLRELISNRLLEIESWNPKKLLGQKIFIGHLVRCQVIPLQNLKRFYRELFEPLYCPVGNEHTVVCGLKLIEIIGDAISPVVVDHWLSKIEEEGKRFCSTRIRCLIMNLMDLRRNNWIRRVPNTLFPMKICKFNESIGNKNGNLPWKPERQRVEECITEEELAIRSVYRNVRTLLNKVTPTSLDVLIQEFISYNVSSNQHQLTEVVKIIFEAASEGPMYCPLYAAICKAQVNQERMDGDLSDFWTALHARVKKIISRIKTSDFQNVSVFISHLYCNQLINKDSLHRCFLKLFPSILPARLFSVLPIWDRRNDEKYVFCGLEMLEIIGSRIGKSKSIARTVILDEWFQILKEVQPPSNNRIRCLIMNLLELRENRWMSSRSIKDTPMTMKDIREFIEKENEVDRPKLFLDKNGVYHLFRSGNFPLPSSRNAWKPERQRKLVTGEEAVSDNICKKVRALFNKVTPTTQYQFTQDFLSYNVSSTEIVNIVFEVAALNPMFCPLYAEICKAKIDNDSLFRDAILSRCHNFIEKDHIADASKLLGETIFIGHLFLNGIIQTDTIRSFCRRLFEPLYRCAINDNSVVCGLKLIETIGYFIEHEIMDKWIRKLEGAKPFCTTRVRCLILNLVDLRKNNWIPKFPRILVPERQKATEHVSEGNTTIEVSCKKVRPLLNKVTHATVEELAKELIAYNTVSDKEQIKKVIKNFFDKAISEHCSLHADILQDALGSIQKSPGISEFTKAIHCNLKTVFCCSQPSEARRYSVFMGHLFIRRLVTQATLETCCRRLLGSISRVPLQKDKIDEDSVLSGLEMFRIIAPFIDKVASEASEAKEFLDDWLQKLEISKEFCTNKTRCLIVSFLESRAKPKTSSNNEKVKRIHLDRDGMYQMPVEQANAQKQHSNVWRSERQRSGCVPNEQETMRNACMNVLSLLNKITPTTVECLTKEFISYIVSSNQHQLFEIVKIVFDKSANEPMYCSLYANICYSYAILESNQKNTKENPVFSNAIHLHLKTVFCNSKASEARKHALLLGHLYRRRLITMDTLQTCCFRLHQSITKGPVRKENIDEDSIRSGIEMFEIIGPRIDNTRKDKEEVKFLNKWFQKLKIAMEFCSNRTRFLIMNLMELRANEWVSRLPPKEKPTTMIHTREIIEKERKEERQKSDIVEQDRAPVGSKPERTDLCMEIRALLDKLIPNNPDEVAPTFISYYATSNEEDLIKINDSIFQNAANDPIHCALYAEICKLYVDKKATAFLSALHTRIEILLQNDSDIQKYSLFIGYLYKSQVIQFQTLQPFFLILFESIPLKKITTKLGSAFMRDRIDEESIRIGIELFEIVGYRLSNEFLEEWFQKLENLQSFCSNDLRFLIMDLMELRENGWVGRSEIQKKTEEKRRREEESESNNNENR